jgi:hypothetical protein
MAMFRDEPLFLYDPDSRNAKIRNLKIRLCPCRSFHVTDANRNLNEVGQRAQAASSALFFRRNESSFFDVACGEISISCAVGDVQAINCTRALYLGNNEGGECGFPDPDSNHFEGFGISHGD